ncbi:MAG: GLPGLI family protein [Dysgonamonadaceae bacterium]|nr:GLPGLI family protein [Dysgonamonadaceae bacterium]
MIYCTMASLLISTSLLNAQSMKAVYQEQLKMPDNARESDNPAIASAVAAQLSRMNKTMVLYYEKGASLFEQLSSSSATSDAQSSFQGNINVQVQQMGGGGCYYKNQKKNESVSQEYIMGKAFLITEPLNSEWKLLSGEKKIADYLCRKAVNDKSVTAWYCPEIPVKDGPYLYQGLPGLILEIEMPTKTITMQSIEFDAVPKDKIQPPKTGKKTGRDEFNKIRTKKREELGVTGEKGISVIKM